MEIQYRNMNGKKDYDILLRCLSELVRGDSHHRYVLQNKMILFSLLNGYITKKQFLILCRKTDLYGGRLGKNETDQSYARRFFSEKCKQGIFIKRERKNGQNRPYDTVYTTGAEGRDRFRKTLSLCGIDFSCEVKVILKSLESWYPYRKHWHEPAHYSHMLGIGDFFAAMLSVNGCSRFAKEIRVGNGLEVCSEKGFGILCQSLASSFRADAYAELGQKLPDMVCVEQEKKTGYEVFCQKGRIEILYEQDTGTQRKDILSSKLENYSRFFHLFSGQPDGQETMLCLLFSCLNLTCGERSLSKRELEEGAKEAGYILSLQSLKYGKKEPEKRSEEKISDTMQNLYAMFQNRMRLSAEKLKEVYSGIRGMSWVLKINDVKGLLHVLERSDLPEHSGNMAAGNWKVFLELLDRHGTEQDINFYEKIFCTVMKKENSREKGNGYASYHRHMKDYIKRKTDMEKGMARYSVLNKEALQGNMIAVVPGNHMLPLLPCLFPGLDIYRKQLKDYLNLMYFGISSFHSYQIRRKDEHGVLLNFFQAGTFSGIKYFCMENISLDITAMTRLAFYLRRYANCPDEYKSNLILLIYFLSDDLPRVREFALDMNLYAPYEKGDLKERFFRLESRQLEVLFVCMEDMLDRNRQLPGIIFDREGCGHYKMFSSLEGPVFLDIPSERVRVDVPEKASF